MTDVEDGPCARLRVAGDTTAFQTPAQFAATVRADLARWAPVVKASGFVADD
ncbi:MAG: hypothetical protein JOZ35_04925 [Hyphomicrobiales bacterium]|nr:hypothetical protein [Hyphomicrobiales bacterium]